MGTIVFRQPKTSAEGAWTTYRYQAFDESTGRFVDQKLDCKVRAMLPHQARAIQQPYLERTDASPTAEEYVPSERNQEFTTDAMDHWVERLGSTDDAEHPNGLDAPFCGACGNLCRDAFPDGPEYGISLCHCKEPREEVRPWPMKPAFKYLLLNMMPGLQAHVVRFAQRLAAPSVRAEERAKQEEENLGLMPHSSQKTPDETASAEG